MDLLLAAIIVVVWIGSCVGLFLYGYQTGYQANNETINGIVDKRVSEIAAASKAKAP